MRWGGGRDELNDDLKVCGLADQVKEIQPVGIWPENALTARVFFDLERQWIEIMTKGGAVPQGLDHGQIKHTLELLGVKRREWPEIFDGLKVMESEAIKTMRGDGAWAT